VIRPVEKLGRNIHTSTIENQTFQNVCDPQICGEEAVGPHSAKFDPAGSTAGSDDRHVSTSRHRCPITKHASSTPCFNI